MARLIRVPGGKREHIGVVLDNDWRPICGQWSGRVYLPLGLGDGLRNTAGVCRDCITAAGSISDLAEAVAS